VTNVKHGPTNGWKPPPANLGLSRFITPSIAAVLVLFIASATVLPFAALIQHVGYLNLSEVLSDVWIQRVIIFSIWQAFLSTLISVGLAIPVAIALSREPHFPGRGWVNQALSILGIPELSLYGLNGILLAHAFFNLPLATRIFLVALDGIPPAHWRLASQLGLHGLARTKQLEWPAIRSHLIGTCVLVFALCLTSFAIVLTLGGGPRATTIEVAIYQAFRFDFDIGTAVTLALVQLLICVAVLVIGSIWKQDVPMVFSALKTTDTWRPVSHWRALNVLIITSAVVFVLLPIAGLVVAALNSSVLGVIQSTLTSIAIINTVIVALSSASLSLIMAVGILLISRHCHYRLHWRYTSQAMRWLGNLILVMPPLVLGTGLFLLLRPYADVFSLALVLVALINALLALPFVLRILEAPVHQLAISHDRLVQSLGVTGWSRFRWLDWPTLKAPSGLAFGIAASLSAGDLGAIALFGSDRVTTLPLLLYQRMGSYRFDEAAFTALLLLLTCLFLFLVSQWVVREPQSAQVKGQTT